MQLKCRSMHVEEIYLFRNVFIHFCIAVGKCQAGGLEEQRLCHLYQRGAGRDQDKSGVSVQTDKQPAKTGWPLITLLSYFVFSSTVLLATYTFH